jgi:hypothetical protein
MLAGIVISFWKGVLAMCSRSGTLQRFTRKGMKAAELGMGRFMCGFPGAESHGAGEGEGNGIRRGIVDCLSVLGSGVTLHPRASIPRQVTVAICCIAMRRCIRSRGEFRFGEEARESSASKFPGQSNSDQWQVVPSIFVQLPGSGAGNVVREAPAPSATAGGMVFPGEPKVGRMELLFSSIRVTLLPKVTPWITD